MKDSVLSYWIDHVNVKYLIFIPPLQLIVIIILLLDLFFMYWIKYWKYKLSVQLYLGNIACYVLILMTFRHLLNLDGQTWNLGTYINHQNDENCAGYAFAQPYPFVHRPIMSPSLRWRNRCWTVWNYKIKIVKSLGYNRHP